MKRQLGKLLIEAGAATLDDVEAALADQSAGEPGRIGELLLSNGKITAAALARALAVQYELPFTELSYVAPEASALVPLEFQRAHRLVLFRIDRDTGVTRIHVALCDPTLTDVVDELRSQIRLEVVVHVAAIDDIETVHAALAGEGVGEPVVMGEVLDEEPPADLPMGVGLAPAAAPAVASLGDLLFADAVDLLSTPEPQADPIEVLPSSFAAEAASDDFFSTGAPAAHPQTDGFFDPVAAAPEAAPPANDFSSVDPPAASPSSDGFFDTAPTAPPPTNDPSFGSAPTAPQALNDGFFGNDPVAPSPSPSEGNFVVEAPGTNLSADGLFGTEAPAGKSGQDDLMAFFEPGDTEPQPAAVPEAAPPRNAGFDFYEAMAPAPSQAPLPVEPPPAAAPAHVTAEELFGSMDLETPAEVAPLSTALADEIGRHDHPPQPEQDYPGFSALAAPLGDAAGDRFGARASSPIAPEPISLARDAPLTASPEPEPSAPEPEVEAAKPIELPKIGLAPLTAPIGERVPLNEKTQVYGGIKSAIEPPRIPSFAIPPDVPIEPRRSPVEPLRRPASALGRIALKRIAVVVAKAPAAPAPEPVAAEAPGAPDLELPSWMRGATDTAPLVAPMAPIVAVPIPIPLATVADGELSAKLVELVTWVESGTLPPGPVIASMIRLLIARRLLDDAAVTAALEKL